MNSFFLQKHKSRNQFICKFEDYGVELWLKREDEIDPVISGNKFRKLKYNLLDAAKIKKSKILTFGGAYSNHIAATAKAAHLFEMESIGVIRGEELAEKGPDLFSENFTLAEAKQNGMQFYFETRENYRKKASQEQLELYKAKFGDVYVVPEGGTNSLAIKGCTEIIDKQDNYFNVIACSAGTGGTAAGIIEASSWHQHILAFSALKGDFLEQEIKKWTAKTNWNLLTQFHFGGYSKVSSNLIQFINQFYTNYHIQLDPIYTGKMMFGLFQLINSGYFSENTRILAVHTGGLQAVKSMNKVLAKKNKKIIQFN